MIERDQRAGVLEECPRVKPANSYVSSPTRQRTPRVAGPQSFETYISVLAGLGIAIHLGLRYLPHVSSPINLIPLYLTLIVGGLPLVVTLFRKLLTGEFGSDL